MVMIEQTRFEDGCLREILPNDVEREQNIIFPGEKMAQGELLASAGTYVTPAHLNIFAMGGVMTVPVKRKPRVAIIPTGDELVPGVLQPGPGTDRRVKLLFYGGEIKRMGRGSSSLADSAGQSGTDSGDAEKCRERGGSHRRRRRFGQGSSRLHAG